jgi:hypothetical protein
MIVARQWGLAMLALAVAASGAAAQANKDAKDKKPAANSCALTSDKPDEVHEANAKVGIATAFGDNPEAKRKALTKAVELLSLNPGKYAVNVNGWQYTLGQALVLWATIPSEAAVVKRGDIGFLGDKDKPIDILVAADSLFTLVEKALPNCVDQISIYRQLPWPKLINPVSPLININQIDSAQKMLDRSMVIYRNSPYPYYFQALIFARKQEYARASASAEKAALLAAPDAAKDSNLAALAEEAAFLAPYYGKRVADTLTGAAQAAAMKRVGVLYQAYLTNNPCATNAEGAQRGFIDAMMAAGEVAAVRAELKALAGDAKPCSDLWWYNAASQALDANDTATAIALADKAVAFSPWSVGLGMAAQVYWKTDQFAKMLPAAHRLTQIAPNSPDDWELLALAYQGLAKQSAAAAPKKAYADSLVMAYNAGTRLVVRVRVSEFTNDGATRNLGGTVELADTGAVGGPPKKAPAKGAKPAPAAKPASGGAGPAPRHVTIKLDFLDRAGATVLSDSTVVMANAEETTHFKMVAKDAKIVGYKYAPVH